MKNAQELLDIIKAKPSEGDADLREQVRQKVDEFTEEWAAENGVIREFTPAEMDKKFINAYVAKYILQEAGFYVEEIPEKETGFLWWKEKTPAKWIIRIPTSNNK